MKIKHLFAGGILLFTAFATVDVQAQEKEVKNKVVEPQTEDDRSKVFVMVSIPEEYSKGNEEFNRLFVKKFKRPKGISKNTEFDLKLSFIVEVDGSLSDIKVLKSPGLGTEEEVIRVLQELGTWKPMVINGRKVKNKHEVLITIPSNKQQKKMK
ncbi:MAG: hypothetical protein LBI72_07665 [Flavobacteriaceae bacterium]|jgi:protein TonB|nr:hypothetical protein [Flavobacteriaceae bacterium]